MQYWFCIIGATNIPVGDAPLRDAVQKAFRLGVGEEAEHCYSGWGVSEKAKEAMLEVLHQLKEFSGKQL